MFAKISSGNQASGNINLNPSTRSSFQGNNRESRHLLLD